MEPDLKHLLARIQSLRDDLERAENEYQAALGTTTIMTKDDVREILIHDLSHAFAGAYMAGKLHTHQFIDLMKRIEKGIFDEPQAEIMVESDKRLKPQEFEGFEKITLDAWRKLKAAVQAMETKGAK